MAVVVVNELAGADQSFYDEVSPRTLSDGRLPDGCSLRIASPGDDGWRVITVWDSEEQFQRFRDEKLIPAIQESGYADRVTANTTARPVYEILTS